MTITAKCPHCGKSFNISPKTQGKLCECPECLDLFRMPQLDKAISKSQDISPNVVIDQDGKFYG